MPKNSQKHNRANTDKIRHSQEKNITKSARTISKNKTSLFRSNAFLLFVLILIVSTIVLITYWPSLSAQAIAIDDDQYFIKNPLVQNPSWSSVGRFFSEVLNPSIVEGYYHPIAMISLMFDYAMGARADNLRILHRTSLLLHMMNVILIILFLYLLFGQPWIAALTALLFGIHPMTVETIPWISERKTLLAAFFVLIALIFYTLYTRKSNKKCYWTSLAMYALALMSKPTSTTLPILLLLLDFWPLKRLNRKSVLEKTPFFVICAVSAVSTYLSQHNYGAAVIFTPIKSILILCHNIVFYLYNIIWPVHLSSFYPFPEPFTFSNPLLFASVIGTILLISLLLISLRWTRALLTGWLFFIIAILPAMGIIGFTNVIAADKYAYLPLIGLLLTLSWLLTLLWEKSSFSKKYHAGQAVMIIVILLLIAFEAIGVRNYLTVWADTGALYRHMLDRAPRSYILHEYYGIKLAENGNQDEAISQYQEALRLNPDEPEVYDEYGSALAAQDKFDEAISFYKNAIHLNPKFAGAFYNRGIALASLGKTDDAISDYKEAIRLKPDLVEAYDNLGALLVAGGKFEEGISYYNKAIRINPGYSNAYYNKGISLGKQGKYEEALLCFKETILLNPRDADANYNIGALLCNLGNFAEAVPYFKEAINIKPDYVNAHYNLGNALAELGKLNEAIEAFQEALKINPNFPEAQSSLDMVMKKLQNSN